MSSVRPQVLSGFRDLLPEQMIARQHVTETARRIFESFGFEPLDTPSLEYASVLMGKMGPEAEGLFYNFEDRGNRHVALRYDLTVPLARFIGSHPEIQRPFKRYQFGTVWRQERPQKGRYREFTQCDADIVGAPAGMADAEIIAILCGIYRALGIHDVTIRVNHRQVLNAMARLAGIPADRIAAALRSIDKLDKVSSDEVAAEMEAGGLPPGAGRRFLELTQTEANFGSVQGLAEILRDKEGLDAVEELEGIGALLSAMGVAAANYRLDLSLARGLDYYTGIIFEANVPDFRPSIGSGGRYDSLIGLFLNQNIPTVGGSVGLDRVIDVLRDRNALPARRTVSEILVTVFSPELRTESLELAAELRSEGLAVETFLGDGPLRKQFIYADQKGLALALVLGPDELKDGKVAVRNLAKREQIAIMRSETARTVRDILGQRESPDGVNGPVPAPQSERAHSR